MNFCLHVRNWDGCDTNSIECVGDCSLSYQEQKESDERDSSGYKHRVSIEM